MATSYPIELRQKAVAAVDRGEKKSHVSRMFGISTYGDCPRSERFHALKLGHRTEHISMVAAWWERQVLAPMTFQGHCDTVLFEA